MHTLSPITQHKNNKRIYNDLILKQFYNYVQYKESIQHMTTDVSQYIILCTHTPIQQGKNHRRSLK